VKSRLGQDFLDCLRRLPEEVRRKARKNYRLGLENSRHPSLGFKPIGATGIWSVRVGIGWRALGWSRRKPSLGFGSGRMPIMTQSFDRFVDLL